jgi:hypothetical protein
MMSQFSPLSTDEVDGVLHAFFKAQTPSPWPAPPAVAKMAKGRPMMRSRLALAASVALLALGLSFLSGAFHGRPNSPEQRVTVEHPSASAENDPLHHSVPTPLKVKTKPMYTP